MRPTVALVGLCLALVGPALADESDPFHVARAEFSLDEDLLLLDLVVDSELPGYITIAIEQGFAVPFMFEVEILAERKYWIDDRMASLKQQYLLHHQPLLDAFVVQNTNSGERNYFADRKAAVHFIEVVYNYPMLDIGNLAADQVYYARARFGIDTDELPLPLKSSSLWDNDWDLQSDWFEWKIDRPTS